MVFAPEPVVSRLNSVYFKGNPVFRCVGKQAITINTDYATNSQPPVIYGVVPPAYSPQYAPDAAYAEPRYAPQSAYAPPEAMAVKVQAPQAPQGPQGFLNVTVPFGTMAGAILQVQAPNGLLVSVTVPVGVLPG